MSRLPLFSLAVLLATHPGLVRSEPIYKWKDHSGKVHFSSSPPHPDATPAKLPQIQRGEPLTIIPVATCQMHGGINCEAGADSDGSVICADGFKDALSRFRLTCLSAKLEIISITPSSEKKGPYFKVLLRNKKQVRAEDVVVSFREEGKKPVALTGPVTIDSLGSEEYLFLSLSGKTPEPREFEVQCANCPE